jgi:hypothetical protein
MKMIRPQANCAMATNTKKKVPPILPSESVTMSATGVAELVTAGMLSIDIVRATRKRKPNRVAIKVELHMARGTTICGS